MGAWGAKGARSAMSANDIKLHVVPTLTHGRVLVREPRAVAQKGILVGFHGYMENARIQMERLAAIPGSSAWTLVSIQGLHRFYRGRTDDVVASWMTREDRDEAIADNLGYVAAALEHVPHDQSTRVVYTGFSQGVAMAFRAAVLGTARAVAIAAVGGDVPPELLEDQARRFPAVLFTRGARDEWLTQPRFDRDVTALSGRSIALTTRVYDGAHEWNGEVSEAIGEFLKTLPSRYS
ncbi:MAG TPA: dienelactone hydrolase family protein [Vicinamibacterales bacterium]|jgi:predicted esterase|nr:dienelactone hydrolase family protein [Vicinamibacterales bacterium]